ncbi:MAG: hypothetical protein ACQEUT_18115 [Bacillota bacterium]
MYAIKLDANNRPVAEGIDALTPVTVSAATTGKVQVTVPKGSFSFAIKRSPVDATISVNGSDHFPIDEGDQFGNFIELQTIEVDVKATSSENIVLLFVQ